MEGVVGSNPTLSTNAINRFTMEHQPNVIIIHGCPDAKEQFLSPAERSYDKHWYQWTKQQLELQGIQADVPLMPNPWTPEYTTFKAEFEKYPVNEKSILIGHSCGGAFLVRWLGETKTKVAKLILVAPWKIFRLDDPARQAFYNFTIDQTLPASIGEIIIFTSDDDGEDGAKESVEQFHQALGGQLIELKGRGHYIQGDMGTSEFPELLEVILR